MKLFVLLFFPFFWISCQQSPEKKFNYEDVHFTIPEGWSISKKDIKNNGLVLMIKKDGILFYPYLILSMGNEAKDLQVMAEITKTVMKEDNAYKLIGFQAGEIKETYYSGFDAKYFDFTLSASKQFGKAFFFRNVNKSFSILEFSNSKNDSIFRSIEKSFVISE